MLGEVDGGFAVAMDTLDLFRPSVGAFAVGMAQAALDSAVAHTKEREAFGKPLSHFQGVSHQLAEVATRDPGGAAARPGRRDRVRRRRPPDPEGLGDGQALRDRGRPAGRRRRDPVSTAPARSSGATCSSTSIVRCARHASTRARRRCSGRSSPASCSRRPGEPGEVAHVHVVPRAGGDPRRATADLGRARRDSLHRGPRRSTSSGSSS